MEVDDIARGWSVYTEDGKRIGDVVEVHPHYMLVSRGVLVVRDIYVPRYAVAAVENRKVVLAITDERLRKMNWTAPPPPPPLPDDDQSPRLVPRPDEEYGPPPLSFRDEAEENAFGSVPQDDASYSQYGFGEPLTTNAVDELPTILDDYEDMGILFGSAVEVDGEAYLATRRIGEGPPIVFIHGWGLDSRVWDYLTLDLPRDYTVVTYDARGYGRSTAPWNGYTVDQASRDLRVLLRTLDLEQATLVGLDLGAATALHYALDGGRRARRLILIAPAIVPAASIGEALVAPMVHEWHDELRRDRPRLAVQIARLWAPQASPETQGWLRDALLSAAPHALLNGLDTLGLPLLAEPLELVGLPTVVLHGRDDPVTPLARGQEVAAAISGARLVVLDTPGHLPMLADPERIAAEIRLAIEGEPATAPEPDDLLADAESGEPAATMPADAPEADGPTE